LNSQNIDEIIDVSENNLEKLMLERRKILVHCVNLECKNEQLKILIEKLHKISEQREDLYLKIQDSKEVLGGADHLYLRKTSIAEELLNAKEKSRNLERTISYLKNVIVKIDGKLAS